MRNRYLQRGLLGLLVLQHDDVVPTTRAHSSSNTPGEGLAALRRPRASWAMGRALNRVPTTHRDTSPMHVISEHGTLLVAAALTVSVDARRRSGIRGGLIKAVRISTLTVAGRCCGRAALVCFGLARHVQREVRSGAWKFVVAARTAVQQQRRAHIYRSPSTLPCSAFPERLFSPFPPPSTSPTPVRPAFVQCGAARLHFSIALIPSTATILLDPGSS